MIRECKKHGPVDHYERKGRLNGWKCKECNKAQQRKFKDKKKDMLLSMAGGKCKICSYCKCKDALHFHHLRDKKFELQKEVIARIPLAVVLEEYNKCVLLCANCHSEVHAGVAQIPASLAQLAEATDLNPVQ